MSIFFILGILVYIIDAMICKRYAMCVDCRKVITILITRIYFIIVLNIVYKYLFCKSTLGYQIVWETSITTATV